MPPDVISEKEIFSLIFSPLKSIKILIESGFERRDIGAKKSCSYYPPYPLRNRTDLKPDMEYL